MSMDERAAELRERLSQARTNRGIARNVALDHARFIEKTIVELRRKLEHDPTDSLTSGGTIPYMGLFGTSVVELEKNLVRIVHFDSDYAVAKTDLEELQQEAALARLTAEGRTPIPIRGIIGNGVPAGGPADAADHAFVAPGTDQPGFNENNCAQCGFKPEWHPLAAAKAEARDPWITHLFTPEPGNQELCAQLVEGRDEQAACHQVPAAHKSMEDLRPDPRSHRFQGGHGSMCTYSSYGVECGGTRRDHELM